MSASSNNRPRDKAISFSPSLKQIGQEKVFAVIFAKNRLRCKCVSAHFAQITVTQKNMSGIKVFPATFTQKIGHMKKVCPVSFAKQKDERCASN